MTQRSKISYFYRYILSTRPYWKYMYAAFIMMLIMVAIAMTLPRFFKIIIDDYIPDKNFDAVMHGCLIIAGLYFIRM